MRTIKRKDVIFRNPTVIILISLGVLFVLSMIIPIFFKSFSTVEINDRIMSSIYVTLGVLIISAFVAIPSYIKLKNMEKALDIDFNEEMKKLNVKSFNYIDNYWFIIKCSFIINRNYVKELMRVNRVYEKNVDGMAEGHNYVYKIKTINDKIVKYIDLEDSNRFQVWLEHEQWYKK